MSDQHDQTEMDALRNALEASDRDRQKLKARVKTLEAELAKATKPKSGIEFVRKLFFEHGD
jgi:3-phenylpropionate/cinnamic acid dioxygenase small subunit